MIVDGLIVGQGLAGSILAWELINHGQRVLVIDDGAENASQVAAGLINPVTGQRLVKTVHVEHLLPAALACYKQLADYFRRPFFYPLSMWRLLASDQERHTAEKRLSQADYGPFLDDVRLAPPGIVAPVGLLVQRQTGYVLTRPLLQAIKIFLQSRDSYRQAYFDVNDLRLQPLQWRDVRGRYLIFCQGHQGRANPWFQGLPWQPVKGEIVTAKTDRPLPPAMLNYGHWLIPQEQAGLFKTGATFTREGLDNRLTEVARTELWRTLLAVFPAAASAHIIEQQAGIRPGTLDKQPLVGVHPRHPCLYLFNGFGAKGSLSIPWYSRCLVDALLHQLPLPSHASLQRYHATHFPD